MMKSRILTSQRNPENKNADIFFTLQLRRNFLIENNEEKNPIDVPSRISFTKIEKGIKSKLSTPFDRPIIDWAYTGMICNRP